MIRKATMDDIPALARIETASFTPAHYPIDEDTFYELMMDPAQIILVAENAKNGASGYLLAEIMTGRESLSIDSVAVLPAHRNAGIGKELMQAALKYAKNRNIPAVSLETPENNPPLKKFYEALGFKTVEHKEKFYADNSACLVMKLVFTLFLMVLPLPASAEGVPSLIQPVRCLPGEDCWVVNYPDTDKTEDTAKDFTCGALSYDTHDGTDFGIRDLVAMETGIPVIAATGGRVLRKRDGAADRMPDKNDRETMLREKKGCGNGVVLDHGNGWQTIYCHMKKDSIGVKEGQEVQAGDVLGLVGHSGVAEFPHLHFTVFRDGSVIDPFTGLTLDQPCGAAGQALWAAPTPYEGVSLYAAGFKAGVPDIESLKIDATPPPTIRRGENESLTFWIMIYGAVSGDKINMDIIGPGDQIIATYNIVQEKTRARQFYYIGKTFGEKWPPAGTYTGIATLIRTGTDGKTLTRTKDITVNLY